MAWTRYNENIIFRRFNIIMGDLSVKILKLILNYPKWQDAEILQQYLEYRVCKNISISGYKLRNRL